jgi:hypothetical protein
MKKSRMQYASGLGGWGEDIFREGIQNLLNDTKNVLKLEEIMWKSDYAQFINKG